MYWKLWITLDMPYALVTLIAQYLIGNFSPPGYILVSKLISITGKIVHIIQWLNK